MAENNAPKGCSFLLNPVGSEEIASPEAFSDDQRAFAKSAEEFMRREILPDAERLEAQEDGLMLSKLQKAGEMGLLMIDIPEEYGGLGLDKTTSMLCTEKVSLYAGFSVTHGAHTGIGTLPLLFFGNADQKERYLPRLATGEIVAAYALTEPGSGSDALGAKTTAELVTGDDGREYYKLNGTKMWITNAGFADLFTVFAKVDGSKFTAFLVEASYDGVSTAAEEHKMGIKGSSTRMLILDDVMVPAENLLGTIGRGHKIAFNILNIGRIKLGAGTLGGGKHCLENAIRYAQDRAQFGQPIANFGAIRQKIARMATRLYALESMCYRAAGDIDTLIEGVDADAEDYSRAVMEAIEEFAIEDSIMKVYGSEAIDFVSDEAVQIHGGYGYSKEFEVERIYRDSRINRIFEGTNEINRMLIPGMLLKRTMKGELPLFDLIGEIEKTVKSERQTPPAPADDSLEYEEFLVEKGKQLAIWVANLAIQRHMADLKDRQELLLAMADMLIDIYAMDSTVTRVAQLGDDARDVHWAIAKLATYEAYDNVVRIAHALIPSLAPAEKLERRFDAASKFTFPVAVDRIALEATVTEHMLELPRWSF